MSKRIFDILLSFIGLLLSGWFILLCLAVAAADINGNGLFTQLRVGRNGKLFTIYKIRTISSDNKISRLGSFFRKTKIDELPQLWNVLIGDMSMVGPRPDVPGYYDRLEGEERKVLELRPGITGPASLKYYNEEEILALQEDKQQYNDKVIFPDKVNINMAYRNNHSVLGDIKIIFNTLFARLQKQNKL